MRTLVQFIVVSLVSLACLDYARSQTLTWEQPTSPRTSATIAEIVDHRTIDDVEDTVSGIPESERDLTRREILHGIVAESFNHNNWSSTSFLVNIIKRAQAASLLAPNPSKLHSLTIANLGEAESLRNLVGYPSLHHGSLLLWARQFDLNAVTPTMRNAQYTVSLVRDETASSTLRVLERLIGARYAGLSAIPSDAPQHLLTSSELGLAEGRAGSTIRMSLGEFFVAVAIGKLSVLLPSLPLDEQPLLELAILNGVDGAAWQGASWAALAYRSRLSSFLQVLDSPGSVFSEADRTRLQHRVVAAAFFARAFAAAAARYLAFAERPEATSSDKVYGYHGAGLSYIALGDEKMGYGYLQDAAVHLDWDRNLPYAFSLVSLDRATMRSFLAAEAEAAVPEIEEGMLRTFATILNLYSTNQGRQLFEDMNEDFLRVLYTMVRPDIAIRHSIKQVQILDNDWPEADRRRLQSFFVREICAFLNDLFYEISFDWRDGEWERTSGGAEEFLPTMVQLQMPERFDDLYSKAHPEEDRAVTLENAVVSRDLLKCQAGNDQPACVAFEASIPSGFESIDVWVEHHQGAKLQPSRAFLKAIWSYWFGLALEGKLPSDVEGFVYSPEDVFPSLSLQSARRFLTDSRRKTESRELEILKLMIESREFLHTRFGDTSH